MKAGAINHDDATQPNLYLSFARTGIEQSGFVQTAEQGPWSVVPEPTIPSSERLQNPRQASEWIRQVCIGFFNEGMNP